MKNKEMAETISLFLAKAALIDTKRKSVNPPAFYGEPPKGLAPPLELLAPPLKRLLHPLFHVFPDFAPP